MIALASACLSQTTLPSGTRTIEIKLPDGVASEKMFIRYVLDDDDLGGWVQPRLGVFSYRIDTSYEGRPASRVRAILYAPGCAIQTLDVTLSGTESEEYAFPCRPLSNTSILGTLTRSDRLFDHAVNIHATYIAHWAESFLGLADNIVTMIPVGDMVDLSPDGNFQLSVPDFSKDALTGSANAGEFQIWANDRTTDKLVAQFIPVGAPSTKTHMGGLKIRSEYQSEIGFAPCATNPPVKRDAFGFALRPDSNDSCDR